MIIYPFKISYTYPKKRKILKEYIIQKNDISPYRRVSLFFKIFILIALQSLETSKLHLCLPPFSPFIFCDISLHFWWMKKTKSSSILQTQINNEEIDVASKKSKHPRDKNLVDSRNLSSTNLIRQKTRNQSRIQSYNLSFLTSI